MGDEETLLPAKQALSLTTKLGYGFGEISTFVSSFVYSFFLNAYLLEVAGVRAFVVGTILLIAQGWDAISDPIIGKLSDATKSKMGRRRPWILFSALPLGFFYFFLWFDPTFFDDEEALKAIWFLCVLLLYNTAHTTYTVPYTALTPDLTEDYDERTTLTMYRQFFGIGSSLVAAFAVGYLIETFSTYQMGYTVSAIGVGIALVIPPFAVFFTTKENFKIAEEERKQFSLRSSMFGFGLDMKAALKNRPFIVVMLVYLLSWLAINMVTNNLFLWTKYVLEAEDHFTWILLTVQACAALCLIPWSIVSARIGKKNTYFTGITFLTLVEMGLLFLDDTVPIYVDYVLAAFAGIGISVAYLIPWSMLPDVVELDELESGKRREGIFYSMFAFFQKVGLALGLAISSYVLGWTGYVKPENDEEDVITEQPDSVLWALSILIGPVPSVLLVLSMIAVTFYPITREKHDEIRCTLEKQRRERDAARRTPSSPHRSYE